MRSESQYQSEFAKKYVAVGREEGVAEGKARALLDVLAARGITVDGRSEKRIVGCTATRQLDAWIKRAVSVDRVRDLFVDHAAARRPVAKKRKAG